MGEGGNLLNILHVTCSALYVVFHFSHKIWWCSIFFRTYKGQKYNSTWLRQKQWFIKQAYITTNSGAAWLQSQVNSRGSYNIIKMHSYSPALKSKQCHLGSVVQESQIILAKWLPATFICLSSAPRETKFVFQLLHRVPGLSPPGPLWVTWPALSKKQCHGDFSAWLARPVFYCLFSFLDKKLYQKHMGLLWGLGSFPGKIRNSQRIGGWAKHRVAG